MTRRVAVLFTLAALLPGTGACGDGELAAPGAEPPLAAGPPALATGMPAAPTIPFPQSWNVVETLPDFGTCTNGAVGFMGDIDGDAHMDVVQRCHDDRRLRIWERDGASFALRLNAHIGGFQGGVVVADVDGDGHIEVTTGSFSRLYIFESTGSDTYALRHAQAYAGIEHTSIGDSDGDGRLEYLTGSEGFPSRFNVLEAQGNDTYVLEATLFGLGGDVDRGGTSDFDNDGVNELTFGDNQFRFDGNLYVFENRTEVRRYTATDAWTQGVADTDGDGDGEVLGVEPRRNVTRIHGSGWNVVIFESDGSDNGLTEVFRDGADHVGSARDLDGDGISEFIRVSGVAGSQEAFQVSRPTSTGFQQIYDSGSMLAGGGPVTGVIPVGDLDGDGDPEIAVFQNGDIHHLEAGPGGALAVELDVQPGSCVNPLNARKRGAIPAAILGSDDVDIAEIDGPSLTLAGAPALRWAVEDVGTPGDCSAGPDGTSDLTVKFDAQTVIGALGSPADGDEVTLRLAGSLTGGQAIMGSDIVRMLVKGR